jgi:hypothetical protein
VTWVVRERIALPRTKRIERRKRLLATLDLPATLVQ